MIPKIAAVDLNVADVILKDYQQEGQIEQYIEALQKAHDGRDRFPLTEDQFNKLSPMLARRDVALCKGGTTSGALETIGRLGKGEPKHQIIGVLGEGAYSKIVEGDLKGSGVEIVPVINGVNPVTAVSIVLRPPGKPPIIATYPGNAKEIVMPWRLPKDIISNADALYIQGSMSDGQGSMRGRFDSTVMDTLLKYRKEKNEKGFNQKLIVALPNTAFQDAYDWKLATGSADIVVSNMENLKACFPMENGDSIMQLQAHMRGCNEVLAKQFNNTEGQVAFIYDGNNDAWVVTADDKIPIPPVESKNKVAYPLGVEDSAYAGFLTGHLSGMKLQESGHLAMLLAAAKQSDEWPSLQDPRATLMELRAGTSALRRLDNCLRGDGQRFVASHQSIPDTEKPTHGGYFYG